MTRKPLILVTNDDGIHAPGIVALVETAMSFGDVVVVAPDKPQSGMGHAITINSTLRVERTNAHPGAESWSCSGTPVDCVKMAVNKLLPSKPALVLSGINHGANHSINIIYSGTMSAAMEGAIEGIPSAGFSLLDYSINADFSASKVIAEKVIAFLLKKGLPGGVCLNVNIPKLHIDEIRGIRVCRQANGTWVEELDERTDPSGRKYYWLTGSFKNFEPEATDTDVWALSNNYVSVVPAGTDLTAHSALEKIHPLNGAHPGKR
ncbi:MAG TPA: 5'/3'-nucleotidase SurE [Bacteroidia bacterium]|nr:5'/3'-nucleotidase SurE [Bacteroidia bacterium]